MVGPLDNVSLLYCEGRAYGHGWPFCLVVAFCQNEMTLLPISVYAR